MSIAPNRAPPPTLQVYETTRLSLLAEYRRAFNNARFYYERSVIAHESGELGSSGVWQRFSREAYEVAWAYRDVVLALDAAFRDAWRAERARVRHKTVLKLLYPVPSLYEGSRSLTESPA